MEEVGGGDEGPAVLTNGECRESDLPIPVELGKAHPEQARPHEEQVGRIAFRSVADADPPPRLMLEDVLWSDQGNDKLGKQILAVERPAGRVVKVVGW